MSINGHSLPQLNGKRFLTDGGMETTLVFHEGMDLPEFAAFVLLDSEDGPERFKRYFRSYLDIAVESDMGFVLETVTWRANPDWGTKLGYDARGLARINREAVRLLEEVRDEYAATGIPIVISGNIGPRGDGYVAGALMSVGEAREYHGDQVRTFAVTAAELITSMTLTYPEEAAGIVLAAQDCGLPSVIGFTTETDGRLPDGTALRDAIGLVDRETGGGPAYYMVNCAHPDHFSGALDEGAAWTSRIRAVRANASRMSHAELDESEVLDEGNPAEFGDLHRQLQKRLPHLSVFGGCCGTDHRHVSAVCQAIT